MPYSTHYKIKPTKKDWKSIALLLCLFYFISPCEAQLNTLMREAVESTVRTAPKTIIKTEARVLPKALIKTTVIHEAINPILSSFERSPRISSAYKENARNFYKHLREGTNEAAEILEERIADDTREQIIEDIAEELDDNSYLDDILENPLYPNLKHSICKMYKRDSLTEKDIRLILNGGAIDSTCIDEETLFAIYFKMSDSFAEKELTNIAQAGNCDDSTLMEVTKIASERKLFFSSAECVPNNDDEAISDVIVYILLSIILYRFIRRIVRKFRKPNPETTVTES